MKLYRLNEVTREYRDGELVYIGTNRLIRKAGHAECEERAEAILDAHLKGRVCGTGCFFVAPDQKRGQLVRYEIKNGALTQEYKSWDIVEIEAEVPAGVNQ